MPTIAMSADFYNKTTELVLQGNRRMAQD